MIKFITLIILFSCGDFQTSLTESVKDENLEPVTKSVFLKAIESTSLNINDSFEIQYQLTQQTPLLVQGSFVTCDIESFVTKKHFSEDEAIIILYDVTHSIKSEDAKCKQALITRKDIYKKKIDFQEYKDFTLNYFSNLFNKVKGLKIFKTKDQERFIVQFQDSTNKKDQNQTLKIQANAKQMIIDFDKAIVPLNIVAVKTGSVTEYELHSSSPKKIFSTFEQSLVTKDKKSITQLPIAKNIDLKRARFKEFNKNINKSHFSEIF